MLTLAEIVEQTCPPTVSAPAWRSALYRYLDDPTVRKILGGEKHPAYPEASLKMFRVVAELHLKGQITPKTLAAKLESQLKDPSLAYPDTGYLDIGQAPVAPPSPALDLTVQPHQVHAFVRQIGDYVAAQTAERLAQQQAATVPPPEDRLIGAAEASTLLACSPRSVGRLLRRAGIEPVRAGVWKRSTILKYIAQL